MRREKAGPMPDPTYVRELIDANPIWRRAWELSELFNDNAPIGWSAFIEQAETEAAKLQASNVVNVPDVPGPAGMCYKQAPSMERCTFKAGHEGPHQWDRSKPAGEKLAVTIYFAGPVEKVNLPDAIAFIKGKYPDAEIAVEHVREPLQRKS